MSLATRAPRLQGTQYSLLLNLVRVFPPYVRSHPSRPVWTPSSQDVHDTVVRSDSEGRQLLRRTFCTPWRFLVLSGRHRVVADVHHSRPELTITTALAEKGFYTALEITWTVAPEVPGKQHAPHSSNTGVGRTPAALLSLDFRITPSVLPPGPFVPMLRGEHWTRP